MVVAEKLNLTQIVLDEGLELVEDALRRAVSSDVNLLYRAGEHIICSGGKRIRPRVVLLSYRATGGQDISLAVPVAASVELLHTASLIHDDINDHSDMRRGQASANAQFGDGLALLIGDFIFIKLLSLLAGFDSRAIRVLADSCTDIIEGETLQMLSLGDTGMSEEAYLRIVGQKTASLFAACATLGGILAGGAEQEIAALREYGLNLGTAFQIRDDTLDLVGTQDALGKPLVSDLEQGKMSLATLFTLRESNQAREILFAGDESQAIQLLRDTGAIEYAMTRAGEYSARAKAALSILPKSEAKAALVELADFVLNREQ